MKVIAVVLCTLLLGQAVLGRNINSQGLNLIKSFEGFRANFYGDAVVSTCQ